MSVYAPNTAADFLLTAMAQGGTPAAIHSGQNLTLMCWVMLLTPNPSSWRAILCATTNFMIQTNADGLTPGCSTPGQTGSYGPSPMVPGVWYHLCASTQYVSTNVHIINLYVNGVWVVQNVTQTPTYAVYGYYVVGSSTAVAGGGNPLNGLVADVRTFTRILTPSEVWREYKSKIPIAPGLHLWSTFANDIVTDQSGYGHIWGQKVGGGNSLQVGPQPPAFQGRGMQYLR